MTDDQEREQQAQLFTVEVANRIGAVLHPTTPSVALSALIAVFVAIATELELHDPRHLGLRLLDGARDRLATGAAMPADPSTTRH